MVRLKERGPIIPITESTKFQFHSGSIKSEIQALYRAGGDGFQFHSGSIKSGEINRSDVEQMCFNSIVVRLKGCLALRKSGALSCFNSIVVRLKEVINTDNLILFVTFQFHSGSIKRCWSLALSLSSTPFQFHSGSIKSTTLDAEAGTWNRFQFHSGSIKSRKEAYRDEQDRCFNSIVVRLKEYSSGRIRIFNFLFQFHSGSIKRKAGAGMQ